VFKIKKSEFMKKAGTGFRLLCFLSALFIISSCVTTKLPETYKVEPEVLEAKGGNVAFTVQGTVPEKSFHKKAIVEFTPYVKYADGTTKELKKFTLKGEKAEGEGTVINSKTSGSFNYSETFPYEDGMRASELYVNAKITKGKKVTEINDHKLADGIIDTYKGIIHDEELIYAPSGYEKVTMASKNATIYFLVNKSNLDMNLPLNKKEESKAAITELDNFIQQGWKIKDININAWASPEGEISLNTNLANDRAASANDYLAKKIKKFNEDKARKLKVDVKTIEQEIIFNSKGNGEDWDGFMQAVKNSELKDKNQILNVINTQSDINKREQEIRNMTVIYKEIEDQLLPPLRRAEITVNCFEPKRSDEEIAKLAITSPDSLKYPEILHAATLTTDPQTRRTIYKNAFTNKDRDWKAYNNAAAEEIVLGQLADAENLLNQASKLNDKNGKIENNYGVLACHKNDFTKAEQHFLKSATYGENVNYNLGVVNIQKGDYAKALTYFKGIECRHNVALSQMLSGNMNDAMKNLKCAPQGPETSYMLAVYGARTNDPKMVYEYLGKAIKANPSLKSKASTDREFLKYFNEQDFKNIVM
jgi:Tfp pilus assembly protein PilF